MIFIILHIISYIIKKFDNNGVNTCKINANQCSKFVIKYTKNIKLISNVSNCFYIDEDLAIKDIANNFYYY
jgi:hypothetical protein